MIINPKQKISELLEEEKELIAYGALRTHLSKFYKNGVPTISDNFDFIGNSSSYSYINSYIFNTFARDNDYLFENLKNPKYHYLKLNDLIIFGIYIKKLFKNLSQYSKNYKGSTIVDFKFVCQNTANEIYNMFPYLHVKPFLKNSNKSFNRMSTTAFAYYFQLFGDDLNDVITNKVRESFNFLKPEYRPNIKVYTAKFLDKNSFSSLNMYDEICNNADRVNAMPLIYGKSTQEIQIEPEQLDLFDIVDKK